MADPFRPKFVDLVRNFTTTTGTGNFTVGAAVPGHSGLATAVAVGDRFFYCVQGIERPGEREVGRGTMLAGGSVAREPVGGTATNFSTGTKTIALVVAADWFTNLSNWINGGAENLTGLATTDKSSLVAAVNEVAAASSSGSSGGAVGSTLTFASASGAAIPTATMAIETAGYSSVGRGAARYVYDATVNAAFVTVNPRTAFVAAGGRGFRLDAEQRLTIEMFGGKADWNGTTGTDNYAAMKAAHEYAPSALGFSPTIHYGFGKYYCGQTLEPQAAFHIKGQNRGLYSGALVDYVATRLVWPVDTACVRVKNSNTLGLGVTAIGATGAAAGSIIEGVCIQQNSQGTSMVAHGIHARATVIARYCEFTNIAGDCLNIGAIAGSGGATEGDANDWRVEYCFAHQSNGSGLYVWGADANGGTSLNFITHNGVLGCGIRDESYFGNAHVGPQITGYGNKGVHLGGVQYQLLNTNAADTMGGATTPGTTRDIWYPLRTGGITAQFPDWVSGGTYRLALPLFIAAPQTCLFGGYEEHGAVVCHVKGQMYGGGFSTTDSSNATEVNGILQAGIGAKNGIGYYQSTGGEPGADTAAANGTYAYTMLGTKDASAGANGRRNLIEHRVEQDGLSMYWRWIGKDQVLQYLNQKEIFSFGGPATARTYGRSSAQPYHLTLHDFALQDSTNSNNRRILGMRDAAPATGSHAQGEFFFNVAPTASGVLGWSCTTAGTPGTWTAVPVASAGGGTGSVLIDGDANDLRVRNTLGYYLRVNLTSGTDTVVAQSLNPAGNAYGNFRYDGTYHIFRAGSSGSISEVLRLTGTGANVTGVVQVNGTQVVGSRGAAVADATDAASAITQLNALLARCRAHGLIA